MPMYNLKCPKCEKREQRLCPVDERRSQRCETCDEVMELLPSTCTVKWVCSTDTASEGREPSK